MRTDELSQVLLALQNEKARRERVEAELRVAHRLEAVGQLAAGVAHEINTPIQYVGDSAQYLRKAFADLRPLFATVDAVTALLKEKDPALAERLEAAREEADLEFVLESLPKVFERTFDGLERVASIVRAMKAFAHVDSVTCAPADLNEALKNTVVVSRNEHKYVADVKLELGSLPPVSCVLAELNQVFLNLVINAAHAIEERFAATNERGTITLRTLERAGEAIIEIADTGNGIPLEVQERVFDPFFTTKPVGKGTGQGLPIAQSIIRKHHGSLTFASERGAGTTFTIRLPIDVASDEEAA